MESRYDPDVAASFILSLTPRASEPLALRTYTARLIGSEPQLVLHGGGNTSVKTTMRTILGDSVDVLHVKGSGWDLASIEPEGHPAVRLEPLRKLLRLTQMTDEAMVNELRTNLLDASSPTPSVETLLHALLPARFVDHTHADAILSLCDQPEGKGIFTSIFGRRFVWVPYVMPGFGLARKCRDVYEAAITYGQPSFMVLEKHGLFTWGVTAKESYERTIEAVTAAEQYIVEKSHTVDMQGNDRTEVADIYALPRLRGVLAKLAGDAPERGPIVRTRSTRAILSFLERRDAAELVAKGCATPDHVLRTKPTALFLRDALAGADGSMLAIQFEAAIADYAARYGAYFESVSNAKNVTRTRLDPWPRIVLIPAFGVCAIGATAREADVALDIYEHTINVMASAADIGAYAPCSLADLFDVEYWSLEQAKLKPVQQLPLAKCIAMVTGAAGGIGLATAERMLMAGAHVALVDSDFDALVVAVEKLAKGRKERVLMLVADVRDDDAVRGAFTRIVGAWGGVDVVVSNAGNAPEGRLETAAGETALRDSIELNCLSHARVARFAVDIMTRQDRGGSLAFNASKSAFNPGPGFGPYAVAKTALVALMRQYAVDLGAQGIRSNAVNADRIRTHLFAGGVLESRAHARGLSVDDYFRANLLAREVTAYDVADAFVYLASARATTGSILTVDGGNAAAFPR